MLTKAKPAPAPAIAGVGGGVDDVALCLYSWQMKTAIDLPDNLRRGSKIGTAQRRTKLKDLRAAGLDLTPHAEVKALAGLR